MIKMSSICMKNEWASPIFKKRIKECFSSVFSQSSTISPTGDHAGSGHDIGSNTN